MRYSKYLCVEKKNDWRETLNDWRGSATRPRWTLSTPPTTPSALHPSEPVPSCRARTGAPRLGSPSRSPETKAGGPVFFLLYIYYCIMNTAKFIRELQRVAKESNKAGKMLSIKMRENQTNQTNKTQIKPWIPGGGYKPIKVELNEILKIQNPMDRVMAFMERYDSESKLIKHEPVINQVLKATLSILTNVLMAPFFVCVCLPIMLLQKLPPDFKLTTTA